MRVLLADDDAAVRSALRLFLELRPGLEVVGEAAHGRDLATLARQLRADLLLLDWELAELDGPTGWAALRDNAPQLVVLAMSSRREERQQALAAGACAFVCKIDPPEQLLAAVDFCLASASVRPR